MPSFLSHIQTFIQQLTTWITAIGLTGAGGILAYHAGMRHINTDPQASAHHTSSMKKAIVGIGILGSLGALVPFLTTHL